MEKQFVTYKIAKKLKELGFNEPTPHCFIHNSGEEYELELFSFLLGGIGTLSDVYENEKELRNLDFTKNCIKNESEVYFNYNQDIRKLVARTYNGEECMNDPMTYNMAIDSYTYEKWTPKESLDNKILLPNYNDGDFEWDIYQDVISAPSYNQIIDWLRKKYNIDITIMVVMEDSYEIIIHQKRNIPKGFKEIIINPQYQKDTYLEAKKKAILQAIEICLKK